MSNHATIQRTIFTNLPSREQSFGYRIYDDYGQEYCNIMTKEDMESSPAEFFAKARKTFSDVANEILDVALAHGICIDEEWYDLELNDGVWKLSNSKV